MPYNAKISSRNPACVVLLLNQAGSIAAKDRADTDQETTVANIANSFLTSLVMRSMHLAVVRNYYDIGVLGYDSEVDSAFGGPLTGREMASTSEVWEHVLAVEAKNRKVLDDAFEFVEEAVKFPIWFYPSKRSTERNLCRAITMAHQIVSRWTAQHPHSFPPIVINVICGEPTDGDPTAAAQALRDLGTDDGGVLLFNVHLTADTAPLVVCPTERWRQIPHWDYSLEGWRIAELLFNLSSPLPDRLRRVLGDGMLASRFGNVGGFELAEGARGLMLNGNKESATQFMSLLVPWP